MNCIYCFISGLILFHEGSFFLTPVRPGGGGGNKVVKPMRTCILIGLAFESKKDLWS